MTSIVITTLNQRELLEHCLRWLLNMQNNYQIIVADNGSTDGTHEYLESIGIDYVYFDEGTQGFATVWNAIYRNFELGDKIFFMNCSVYPGEKSLQAMEEILERENCIIGPMNNGVVMGPQHCSFDSIKDMISMDVNADISTVQILGVEGGLWGCRSSLIGELDGFDEAFVEYKNVLIDLQLRAVENKKPIYIADKAVAMDIQPLKDFGLCSLLNNDDMAILRSKWGMNYFNQTPNENMTMIIDAPRDASIKVLEVGCDLAATLLDIKNKFPNSEIYGLEINPAAVNIAQHVANVVCGNIEDGTNPFDIQFDYIIFGDVLEHLSNPQAVVEHCKSMLNSHGSILASIPNLMHVTVMEQLLSGRFEYTDAGLLDKTHIHFFTIYEIIIMFEHAGFKIADIKSTSVNLTEKQKKLIDALVGLSTNGVKRYMYESYQYLIKADV